MKKIFLHPWPLRLWHWANALVAVTLIITGIQLRVIGVADLPPKSTVLLVHKYVGWGMAATWISWLLYSLISGHLSRQFAIRRRDFPGTIRQARYYLVSIFREEEIPFRPSPEEKFNPLQKIAYCAIMCIFTPVLVVTGVLLNDIPLFRQNILLWNLVGMLDALHVLCAYVLVLYMIIHIYMSTLGRTAFSHIKAMLVGYEEEPETAKEVTQ